MKKIRIYRNAGEKSRIQWIGHKAFRILYQAPADWEPEKVEANRVIYTGNLFIDPRDKAVYTLSGRFINISLAEYGVMIKLVRNSDIWCCRPILVQTINMHHHHHVKDNSLSKLIQRIREKLDETDKKRYIMTSSGRGYKWKATVQTRYIDR